MFSGIVLGIAEVTSVEQRLGLTRLALTFSENHTLNLNIGASVSVDGVCLTVTDREATTVWFDVIAETLSVTTLGDLQVGSRVNIERSVGFGEEIGGHIISGHIDGVAEITAVTQQNGEYQITMCLPPSCVKYVFHKGFISINGCSVTVAHYVREEGLCTICLIPETLRVTNLQSRAVGDFLNIEIDRQSQVIVDTVRELFSDGDFMSQFIRR